MSEYTPPISEVRTHWGIAVDQHRRAERLAEFDRMIAEVERAAAEKGWEEGEIAGYEDALAEQRGIESHEYTSNPYLKTKEGHDDQS